MAIIRECIRETPFTTEAANAFFSNITQGSGFQNDVSLLTTMRAYYYPRMPKDSTVEIRCLVKSLYGNRDSGSALLAKVIPSDWKTAEDMLTVVSVNAQEDKVGEIFDLLDNLLDGKDGWNKQKNFAKIIARFFKAELYYNTENRHSMIFVPNMNLQLYHIIQVTVALFLPWYSKGGEKASCDDDEKAFLMSIYEDGTSVEAYLEKAEKLAGKYDFERAFIMKALANFETSYERKRITAIDEEVNTNNRWIDDYTSNIRACLVKLRELEIERLGIEAKIKACGQSAIMDYFSVADNLKLISVNDSVLTFVTKGYLDIFDEDKYDANIEYYLDRYASGNISVSDMRLLTDAIFKSGKLKIRSCAAYDFDIGGRVTAKRGYKYGPKFNGYYPNPHIHYYNCMGDYSSTVVECLRARNYVGAFEQCAASGSSLNFTDGAVMESFFPDLYGDGAKMKVIEAPDGSVMKPSEAIKWLKDQEAGNDKAEERKEEEKSHE